MTIRSKIITTLAIAPIVFLILMIAVNLIPNSWVKVNINKSINIINVESQYHEAYYVPGINWLAASDGYSDSIYLNEQISDRSNGIFYSAMMPNYDRYWHGYSVFLRPLLIFFDLSHIRQILVISFMVLVTILTYLVIRNINLLVGVFLITSIALVNPPVIMISLQYSNMFLATIASSIVLMILLSKKRPINEVMIFFAIVGSLTSFLDLLTTPTITLGIPLLLYVAFRIQHKQSKHLLKHVISLISLWGIGYIVSWSAKWIIGSLILHRNIFAEAGAKATYWSSDHSTIESRDVTMFYVVWQWIKRLVLTYPILIAASTGIIYGIINVIKNRIHASRKLIIELFAILIPSLIPLAWAFIVRQHSLEHQWFSYRHLVVALFGISLLVWHLSNFHKKQLPIHKKSGNKSA